MNHLQVLTTDEGVLKVIDQTPTELIKKGTHLCTMRTGKRQTLARQIIIKKVNEVLDYVQPKKGITTAPALKSTCDMIMNFCLTWNIEEIIYVLHRLQMGYYGKFYERLQGAEILEAFKKYEKDERADIIKGIHHNLSYNDDSPIMETLAEKIKESQEIEKDFKRRTLSKAADDLIKRKHMEEKAEKLSNK